MSQQAKQNQHRKTYHFKYRTDIAFFFHTFKPKKKPKRKPPYLPFFFFFISMGLGSKQSPVSTAVKWLGFVTAVWVQSISGNNYTFSNYSDALKTLMNLTQLELNNLSVVKDVGKAFGLLAGLASDRLPTWLILLIGSLEGLVGYGAQWLVVSQKIKPLSYWQVGSYIIHIESLIVFILFIYFLLFFVSQCKSFICVFG